MLGLETVALPPTAATVFVPDRVPVLGFVPIATVTFAVNPLAVLPLPSWAVIWTAGVISAPAVVVLGCTENTSCVATPAVMLKAELVVLPTPVAVRDRTGPALGMRGHLEGPRTVTTTTVSVPDRAPLLG